MVDILFYHLDGQPPDKTLPSLLEKTLERGWRAVVMAGTRERLAILDTALWTYKDDAFLPHTLLEGGEDPDTLREEPALLALSEAGKPPVAFNQPDVLFLVDQAHLPDDLTPYTRVVLMFDGTEEAALTQARAAWKTWRDAGHGVTYWQQEKDRWVKKA